jgi:hypothetical protein
MANVIQVVVCIPALSLRRQITLSPQTAVHTLKDFLPSPDFQLIYGGATLDGEMPLSSYAVNDGDCILAIVKETASFPVWTRLTEDREAFRERMQTIINPTLSSEYARLKDLRMGRAAQRPKFLTALADYQRSLEKRPEEKDNTAIPDRINSPSSDPLPALWLSPESVEMEARS